MNGNLEILNTGHGDLKLSFNPDNPIERDRAKRAVQDMLRRGFVLFIEGGDGKLTRVESFDEATCSYIIADVPGFTPSPEMKAIGEAILKAPKEIVEDESGGVAVIESVQTPQEKRVRKGKIAVPAHKAKATAIGRSAGG